MQIIDSLADVLSKGQYDIIACDIFGVIHDGVTTYPYATDTLKWLSKEGQQVVLLSNSTRLDHVLQEDLAQKFNITPTMYSSILSSGMLTRNFLRDCADWFCGEDVKAESCQASVRPGAALMGPKEFSTHFIKTGKFFVVGNPDWLGPVYHDIQGRIDRTLDWQEMDFCLVGSICNIQGLEGSVDAYNEQSVRTYYQPLLHACLKRKVPLICANPDVWAPSGNTEKGAQKLLICPGYICEMYESMGGKALYFGKPFQSIYRYLLNNASEDGRRRRALCIGDNVATDVLGARQVGLDVVMVLGGVHASELNVQDKETLITQVRTLCQKSDIPEPTYLIPLLACKHV